MPKPLKISAFINGDVVTPAQPLVVPRNLTLELVLDRLTSRLGASFGAVRRLYTLAGKRVNDVSELQDEQFYVASGNSSFRRVDYLHAGAKGASSAKISAKKATQSLPKSKSSSGKVIMVARNGESHAPVRVPLPPSKLTMNQLITLLGSRLSLKAGSVQKLYTASGAVVMEPKELEDKELYVAAASRQAFVPLSYDMWKSGAKSLPKHATTAKAATPNAAIKTSRFNQLEDQIRRLVSNKRQMLTLWRALDFNNNGVVSLAEIDKLVVERFPLLDHKPALMRAYKQTTLKDGDGDAWVEKDEFPALLRNIFFFNKLFHVFDEIDVNDDRRVDMSEFKQGAKRVGLDLPKPALEREFGALDTNGGGFVLFDEFCCWVARNGCPVDGETIAEVTAADKKMENKSHHVAAVRSKHADLDPEIKSSKFDVLEKSVKEILQDKNELRAAWKSCDYNGNGICSLAELDKWIVEHYPLLDHKPALMRAYKQTTLNDGDGDAWVEKAEFVNFVRNVFYFNRLFHAFDQIDTDDDRRLDFEEFRHGLQVIGLSLDEAQAEREFDLMDSNDGNVVLFDEFCSWAARKACPVNDDVVQSFTMASTEMERRMKGARNVNTATRAPDMNADITTKKFDGLESKFQSLLADGRRLAKAWKSLDYNGNGKVSLAEIDKWVVENYPLLNHKPALMRAYKKTILRDGDGDAWVERDEFPALLPNLLYFVKIFTVFADIDKGRDRRIDFKEFYQGLSLLGLAMDQKSAKSEFDAMDANQGGQVLFDEFCAYMAMKMVPIDGHVVQEYTTCS